jgi:membrane protein
VAHAARSEGRWRGGERGRHASRPRDIPAPGWRDILWRVKERIAADKLAMIAAGVAFYALMAIFPALIALVGVYGMLFDPQAVNQQIATLSGFLPEQAADLLVNQLGEITTMDRTSLGVGSIVALLFALWTASGGMRTLMQALNIAYHEEEKRGTLRFYGTALLLTLGAVVAASVAIALVVALPAIIKSLGLGELLENVIGYARWPLLGLGAIIGFAVLYRYAPNRAKPRWQWLSWGAVIATLLWLGASALFSLYVGNFANYNKTYGSMGAVVILLTWFLLTAFCILLGGEINAEIERRSVKQIRS